MVDKKNKLWVKGKVLSGRELNKLVVDKDKPSLLVFIIIETLEWCLYGSIIYIAAMITKPIWLPIWNLIKLLT